jgi:hypothetical protein
MSVVDSEAAAIDGQTDLGDRPVCGVRASDRCEELGRAEPEAGTQ